MAGLPLQPVLRPWPPGLLRVALVLALALAVLVLGLVARQRRPPVQPVLTGPGLAHAYPAAVVDLCATARRRIWVGVYVVYPDRAGPVTAMLTALADAAQRGVRVQVLLNIGVPGDRFSDTNENNRAAGAWLRERGVRVVEDEAELNSHLKVVVVDDATLLVGSQNWTGAASTRNREAALLVTDPDAAQQVMRLLASAPGWDPAY
jgi:phosphatidylserine/phosphatidylglycerophosphate/cardiolipin synthase-like enzyme